MFRPGAPLEEIEEDVESMITELVHQLGRTAEADPEPAGAEERAYIKAFSDARANSDRDQAGLLATAIGRPNLAEALIYLNRLSDHLFVAARYLAKGNGGDILWKPGETRGE